MKRSVFIPSPNLELPFLWLFFIGISFIIINFFLPFISISVLIELNLELLKFFFIKLYEKPFNPQRGSFKPQIIFEKKINTFSPNLFTFDLIPQIISNFEFRWLLKILTYFGGNCPSASIVITFLNFFF